MEKSAVKLSYSDLHSHFDLEGQMPVQKIYLHPEKKKLKYRMLVQQEQQEQQLVQLVQLLAIVLFPSA